LELSERNDLELVLNTIKQLNGKPFGQNALLHSDQGFQYTTKSYENQLEELKIQGSHSRRGNCHDNACIECFFSHLKTEKLYREVVFGAPKNDGTGVSGYSRVYSFLQSQSFLRKTERPFPN